MKRILLHSLAAAAVLTGLSACAHDDPVQTTSTTTTRRVEVKPVTPVSSTTTTVRERTY